MLEMFGFHSKLQLAIYKWFVIGLQQIFNLGLLSSMCRPNAKLADLIN